MSSGSSSASLHAGGASAGGGGSAAVGSAASGWHQHGRRMLSRVRARENSRTCCDCCHIKTGAVFLGLVEMVGVALLFASLMRHMAAKNRDIRACFER